MTGIRPIDNDWRFSTDCEVVLAGADGRCEPDRMHPALVPLLVDQDGVVSRQQAHEVGVLDNDLRRLVRRREITRLHPGVYLDHTGEPTWQQRAWAAVLLCWPAALGGRSALRAAEGPGSTRRLSPIEVAVAHERHPIRRAGLTVVRHRHLEERALWHVGPPRLRYEEAVVDVAADGRSDFEALAELSKAVQGRRTTAQRLSEAIAQRERLARRDWMLGVLEDVASGTCSVLEHGHLTLVDRPHGLAPARRQVRDRLGAGTVFRDVEYDVGMVAELDGRMFHDTTEQRDRDMDRDLLTAVGGKDTVRLSYGQVYDRPCWTAAAMDLLLRARGWTGRARPCGPACWVGRLEFPRE